MKVAKMAAAAVNIQSKTVAQRWEFDGSRPRGRGTGGPETSWAVRTRRSVFQKTGSITSEKGKPVHLMEKTEVVWENTGSGWRRVKTKVWRGSGEGLEGVWSKRALGSRVRAGIYEARE
jgi:hypothetical protein